MALGLVALAVILQITVGLFPVRYGPVMAVDVSSDGRYAISTHQDNRLVLWDLINEQRDVLANDANIYSAYFVPGREAFLWQDLEDRVYIETIDGETLKAFDHFPTYGHAVDHELKHYFSANETWNLFHGYGDELRPVLRDSESPSFVGTGKLLNLGLSEGDYFLTAGRGLSASDSRPIDEEHPPVRPEDDLRFSSNYGGVVLWRYEDLQPVAKLSGNAVKTHATISPDGQWVVSGDENGNLLFWSTDYPEERHIAARDGLGIFQEGLPEGLESSKYWDDSGLIPAPSGITSAQFAVQFIHESEYFLRFTNRSDKATLFEAGNPWPQKYFDLGDSPSLVTYGSQYSRNTAIATAPEAGVLVMGHQSGGGISVYEFDEEERELERTWVVR